jgi:hypothetical protein
LLFHTSAVQEQKAEPSLPRARVGFQYEKVLTCPALGQAWEPLPSVPLLSATQDQRLTDTSPCPHWDDLEGCTSSIPHHLEVLTKTLLVDLAVCMSKMGKLRLGEVNSLVSKWQS